MLIELKAKQLNSGKALKNILEIVIHFEIKNEKHLVSETKSYLKNNNMHLSNDVLNI